MMTRRELLAASTSALVLGTTGAGAIAQTLAAPTSIDDFNFPIIDAHCHVFNAADLPIYGFLSKPIFKLYAEQPGCKDSNSTFLDSTPDFLKRVTANLLAYHMSGAELARTEADALRKANEANRVVDTAGGRSGGGDPVADSIDGFFSITDNRPGPRSAPTRRLSPAVREALNEPVSDKERVALGKLLQEANLASVEGDDGKDVHARRGRGREERERSTEIGRTLVWADKLKGPRASLAIQLSNLYGGVQKMVRLHTPALVDYSYWLDDNPESDFKEQAEVMEQLSIYVARTEGVLFHGYMAYCPLRDMMQPGTSFELLKDAIENKGFIGAKLYPPMGFKALDNARDPDMTFPSHILKTGKTNADVAKALDARLETMYAWCAENGVPILAHAFDSYGGGPCYGKRADPANWTPVANKFKEKGKEIRVCLAHLGEFKNAATQGTDPLVVDQKLLGQTWEWNYGRLVESGHAKNFYADVSDYSQLIHSKGTDDLRKAFVAFAARFKFLSERLIYGSDWILLDREENKKKHLTAVYDFLYGVFRDAGNNPDDTKDIMRNIFSRNAIRFLGIDPGKPADNPAGRRLLAFHKKTGLKPLVCRKGGEIVECPIGTTLLDDFRLA